MATFMATNAACHLVDTTNYLLQSQCLSRCKQNVDIAGGARRISYSFPRYLNIFSLSAGTVCLAEPLQSIAVQVAR